MPLTRYQIRNEYGLADPELYKAADRDDPEALLEGVAMAGLVGVLRQLGDLAEFAAEIFHDLHEEVMATATRGHGLMVRVQQLEAEFPSIEKALLSQTNHSSFFSNAGVDWHPNLRSEQNLITRGDLPRFVMDSYEECRGPPRLFLLDKFDVAGAGACLKRYSDPSFFKVESAFSLASVDMQRERKIRKVKKKGSRWRNGETPEGLLTSHAKLHELFLEERIENGYSDPARRVKLKKRHLNGSAVDSKTRKSYMDKFVETYSPECKLVCATSVTSPVLKLSSDNKNESGLRILDISIVSPAEKSSERSSASSPTNDQEVILKQSMDGLNGGSFYGEIVKGSEQNSDGETDNSYSNLQMVAVEKELKVDGEDKTEGSSEGYNSDDVASEVDNYVDALATMESEMDTDSDCRPKSNLLLMKVDKCRTDSDANEEQHLELQAQSLDSQSNENSSMSDDCNNSFERDRTSLHSDTLSNLVENTPSECNAASKEFPSTEAGVAEDTCIEEGINPDSGDISCNWLVREMSPTLLHPDGGANSPVASYVGPLLDETSSDKSKVGSESFDIKENGTILDHFVAVVPDDSSQAKDASTNASPTHPLDESDEEDLGATSDDLPHLTNAEEKASVNHSGNDSVNQVFHTQCADEDAMGSFTNRKIDSPRLSIPPTEEHLFSSTMTEVQTSSGTTLLPHNSDVGNPDNRVSEVDDPVKPTAFKSGVIPWRRISRESYPEGHPPLTHGLIEQKDAPQTHVLMDQQISDLNEDVSHYEEKFNVKERSRTVDDEEIGLFTSNVDAEGGDSVCVELPSNSPTYSGHGDHVISANIVPETVQVEDVAVSSAAVAKSGDVNDFIDKSPGTSNVDAEEEEGDSVSVDPSNSPTYSGHGDHVISANIVPETVQVEDVAVSSAAVAKSGDVSDFIDKSPGTSNVDAEEEEGDSVSVDPSNSPTYSGHGNHVISDNIVPETVHVEDATVSPAAFAKSDDVNDFIDSAPDAICSPPLNFMNLHESLPDFRDSHLKESELDDVSSLKFVADLEMQKEASKCEVVLPDSESNPSKSVAYGPSSSEVFDDDRNFSLDAESENRLTVYDDPTASTSLEISNQESESQSLDQSHQEYAVSSSTSDLPEANLRETETSLENLLDLQANQVHMERLERDGASDQLEAALERSLEFQSDQLGMECSQEDQASTSSLNFQSAQIWYPNDLDKERSKLSSMDDINQKTCLDTSSEYFPDNFPSQPSTSEFLPESAGQETDLMKQKVEPLESILPIFVQPPVVNLEDTPPLPPLPPMQWRLGKMQHAPLASQRELDGVSHDSFLPLQSMKADEKAQFDLPAPQRELVLPQNPFLSLASEEDMKSQPVSEPLVGHVVHPSPYLQLPTNNDSNYQYNFPDLGGMQFSSPFIQLSKVSGDSSGHYDIALEGEKGLSSSKPFTGPGTECTTFRQDPIFSHGEIVHPQQLMPETGLEPEVLHHSFNNSELEQARPLATSVTAPTMDNEQPQHSLPTSEGDKVESSSKPLTGPDTECTTSRHDPLFSHGPTIQPQQQLMPESGLEPKDLQHSLRNLEWEREKPLATSVTATSMVDEKPQHSLPTSEGETAWSSNTSDVMRDSEVGKSNGTVSKLPRPRNPLIDAVTAHGQSKLKRASERIQPQIEPKVDERDLFLQQIRTKSFNLKPATVTRSTPRPNIQGHNPNLKVISLLEKKAIAIRQAFAGSDEDEDEDSWSDS
ncbi:hypothetical protein M0R45_028850 [Rubus argutus]|uniref:Protein SCAR n=1 Tax=Rubus argutus TaxID=59490 RepID=A0AAW1W797_RUBAR